MKRSQVNQAVREARDYFERYHWALPPNARWDVTDFGLGDFEQYGLVLVNLAEEPEYCEKLMFAFQDQKTPAHCHAKKKEDIIVRVGQLAVQVWLGKPADRPEGEPFTVPVNHEDREVGHGEVIELKAGERVTLVPGVYHEFWPQSAACIIGEVSTANDDRNDNFFINPDIGRYVEMIEDEAPEVKLVSD